MCPSKSFTGGERCAVLETAVPRDCQNWNVWSFITWDLILITFSKEPDRGLRPVAPVQKSLSSLIRWAEFGETTWLQGDIFAFAKESLPNATGHMGSKQRQTEGSSTAASGILVKKQKSWINNDHDNFLHLPSMWNLQNVHTCGWYSWKTHCFLC